jgi:hypothetical protein
LTVVESTPTPTATEPAPPRLENVPCTSISTSVLAIPITLLNWFVAAARAWRHVAVV